MRFEWDERKNRINVQKHGIDFADAWEVFEAPMLTGLDDRIDYGEARWIGVGLLRSRVVVLVWTEPDEDTIRLISVRKALANERQKYEAAVQNQLGETGSADGRSD